MPATARDLAFRRSSARDRNRGRLGLGRPNASLLAVAAGALLLGGSPSLADESIGGARIVVNLVSGELPTGGDVTVYQGDDVFRDEGVRTNASSAAKLVLRDSTNLSIGPSSFIKLDRFVYAGSNQPGAIAVHLVKGALRFATGDADKQAYVINTPTATLGVRGTVLKILSTKAKTYVVLAEGRARVCARAGASCLNLTELNQRAIVTETKAAVDHSLADPTKAVFAGFLKDDMDVTTAFASNSAAPGSGGDSSASSVGAAASSSGDSSSAASSSGDSSSAASSNGDSASCGESGHGHGSGR